jgi:8-amino-7-oxononanoate synthase
MLGSNNYLGLTHHPHVLAAGEAAMRRYGSGATGSRLLNGTLDLHETLEARLAAFLRKDAALVFTTGYQASLGAIATLVGRDDHLFLDKLDHACIVDGARLSLGTVTRHAHGDLAQLGRQLAAAPAGAGKLVVTDGVFSMEGTIADLPGLTTLCRAHGAALLVDDAHALGVLGEDGAGTARHFGLDAEVDLVMATFSKSLASVGGVVAGPADAIRFIRHHARALIFTAAMPPASVAGTLAALDVMHDEPERRLRLWANTRRMAEGLRGLGLATGRSATPILPVTVGPLAVTLQVWRALFDADVFVHPVLPPAVPGNECRIRLSMTAEHTDAQIDRVLEAFGRAVRRFAPEALAATAA